MIIAFVKGNKTRTEHLLLLLLLLLLKCSLRNNSHKVYDTVTDSIMQQVIRFVFYASDIKYGHVNNIRYITAQSVPSQTLAVQLNALLDFHSKTHI
jgi:hypothetical protein